MRVSILKRGGNKFDNSWFHHLLYEERDPEMLVSHGLINAKPKLEYRILVYAFFFHLFLPLCSIIIFIIMFWNTVLGSLTKRQSHMFPGTDADDKVLFVVWGAPTDLCTWSNFFWCSGQMCTESPSQLPSSKMIGESQGCDLWPWTSVKGTDHALRKKAT